MNTPMTPYQIIGPQRDQVGESPVWHVGQQALWWVDIEGRRLRRYRLADGSLAEWALPERTGCIALTQDGRVIAAMESRIACLHPGAEGRLDDRQTLAHIDHPAPNMRFNDGRCDASGRLWVGTMVMDRPEGSNLGGLYCLDERGLTGPHVTGLITPNGSGFSPDGRIFYLSDSHPTVQKVWAYDYDLQSAQLSGRRLFVDMTPLPGRPDGAAVDAEGTYWICGNDAGQIHGFSPSGERLRSLAVPVPKPAMCAFGGPELRTLFVTSIVPGNPALDPAALSGALLSLDAGTQGRPEPFFSRFPTVHGH